MYDLLISRPYKHMKTFPVTLLKRGRPWRRNQWVYFNVPLDGDSKTQPTFQQLSVLATLPQWVPRICRVHAHCTLSYSMLWEFPFQWHHRLPGVIWHNDCNCPQSSFANYIYTYAHESGVEGLKKYEGAVLDASFWVSTCFSPKSLIGFNGE